MFEVVPGCSQPVLERIHHVLDRIVGASFGNPNDKGTVPGLYKDYVKRIASTLQKTLSMSGSDEQPSQHVAMTPPSVSAPPAPPTRLTSGQLLLVLQEGDALRLAGGEGSTRFGAVNDGGRVDLTKGGRR